MAQPAKVTEDDRAWMERLRQKVMLEIAVTAESALPHAPPEPMMPPFADLRDNR